MSQSQSYRTGRATGLALEQTSSALFDEAGVGGTALAAQDECLDVSDQFFLDSGRRYASLEHHTYLLAGTRGTEFVEQELVDVVGITIHRVDDVCEITQDGLAALNEYVRLGHGPTRALTDVLGYTLTRTVEQGIVVVVGHRPAESWPPFHPTGHHRRLANGQRPERRTKPVDEALEVKVARTHPGARLPTRGSEHAAGWDLYALEDTVVPFRQSMKLRTGLHVAIPVGYEGQVRARSSLGSKGLILPHSIGTIDADYRGELFVLMTWIGEGDSYTVRAGERIAQILISPIPDVGFQEVDFEDLGETERGEGGFGSTGRF